MTPAQQQAATQAMNGTSPHTFMLVLVGIGFVILMVWLASVAFGFIQTLKSKNDSANEIMFWGAIALLVVILVAGILTS